jgi:2-polyprenyl-3-methyl-5-hydroxy-6-metoxy-1,4-benzoquinol methylase
MQPTEKDIALKTQNWYKDYYQKKGQRRNDLLSNPEVLFQYLAIESAVISTLRKATGLDREVSKILDVGCGGGGLAKIYPIGICT